MMVFSVFKRADTSTIEHTFVLTQVHREQNGYRVFRDLKNPLKT